MKDIQIKTSWDDVTVDEFNEMIDILDMETNILDRELKTIEVLSNKSFDELKGLNKHMLEAVQKRLKFLNQYPQGQLKYEFVIDHVLYNPVLELDKITTDRFTHILALKDNVRENIALLFASLLRENKTPYNEMDINALAEKVKDEVSIEDVFGVVNYYAKLYITAYQVVEQMVEGDVKIQMMKHNPVKILQEHMRSRNGNQ